MGDQAYAYRGHSYDSDEEWKNKNYGRNQVSHAAIYDSDGGKRSSIHGASPYGNSETYIFETEIIEHIRATVGSEYIYSSGSPKRIDQKYQRPSSPYPPPEVDHFLSGVPVEASRPSPHRYGHSNGHDRKNGYGNGYGDYRKGYDYGGGFSSSDEDDGEEGHNYNYPQPEPELVCNNNGSCTWVKPGNGHGRKPGSLNMPTDSIEEAIKILKGGQKGEVVKHYGSSTYVNLYGSGEAVNPNGYRSSVEAEKPYGSSTTVKPYGSSEAVNPYEKSYGSTLKPYESVEAVKPYGYGSGEVVKPSGSSTTVKPYGLGEAVKPYGSSTTVKPYGSSEAVKPYGSSNNVKPYGSGEAVKPYGYGSSTEVEKPYELSTTVKPYGSGEVVKPYSYGSPEKPYDYGSSTTAKPYGSGEAVKPYGYASKTEEPYVSKYQTPTYPQTSTGSAQPVMDYYEAVKRYNAKLILVGHSAGELKITEILHKFPNNIHVAVYIAAIMMKNGISLPHGTRKLPCFPEEDLCDYMFQELEHKIKNLIPNSGIIKPDHQRQLLHNMSPIEDSTLASMLLRPSPVRPMFDAQFEETTGIDSIPRVYIKTLDDHLMAEEEHEDMIKQWPPSQVFALESDHGPFFSTPSQLFGILVEASAFIK